MKIDSYMPVEIISGRNCVVENANIFRTLGKRCLIVTGGTSAVKCGALKDAETALESVGIGYDVFNEITQNPYTEDCYRAGVTARETGADFILGIGGGSPLDAAKAVAVYAADPEIGPADIYKMNIVKSPLPVALIGTTAGTGSEVTGVSVLTNSDTGMKKSISGKNCYAKVSFCDHGYTMSVPYDFTVSTALDALAHAVESYFSSTSNYISENFAEKALVLVWKNLKILRNLKSPDEKMREELYIGSIFSGLALNITGTCFPHTVGYVLTEDFGIPHGKACAAFMPEFAAMAEEAMKEKTERFYSIMQTDAEEFADTVKELADVNIKMTEEQIAGYIDRWNAAPIKNFSRTPGNFTADTAEKILGKYL